MNFKRIVTIIFVLIFMTLLIQGCASFEKNLMKQIMALPGAEHITLIGTRWEPQKEKCSFEACFDAAFLAACVVGEGPTYAEAFKNLRTKIDSAVEEDDNLE